VIDQYTNRFKVLTVLLVDFERFVVHANLDTLLSNVLRCVVLELVDVVHHASAIRLGSGEHQQVL
jgi:hypothetical protein